MTAPSPARRHAGALVAAFGMAAVLAGCATVAPPPAPRPGVADALPPVAGRFALRLTDAGGGVRSTSARFEAVGDDTDGRLSLYTPVGTTLAQARWRGSTVELATPLETRRFASPEALAQAMLGEPLPLQALMHWLRGRPWPQAPHRRLVDPAGFEQLGWRVVTAGLPEGALTASRTTPAPAVDLRIRLDPPAP